ncbi:glutathione peroxidase [Cereibacter sphaeroides]|uniref:glutathione peroxidase n=1 Tax=Cereibacter sphaeroides TaxID=1063 RepID=UPI000E5A7EC8|nr:glutathione peroxidase [Cereibacter sphaeroides]RIA00263.1 glutathione peroxidase [Cereibacter sphaeroides]
MTVRPHLALAFACLAAPALAAGPPPVTFDSIDGGQIRLDELRTAGPVLVVNTASLCGFTPQYDDLQALWDRYRDAGLTVLAVPSNDFKQELDDAGAVRDFCATNFDLTLPMTTITPVTGAEAHPFYRWLAQEHGVEPRWNFHKVLIDRDGDLVASWSSPVRPTDREIVGRIEALLP